MNIQSPHLPRVTQAAEGLPRRRWTVDECYALVEAGIIDEKERFELIGGEMVPMSPKGMKHEVLKQWLNKNLTKQLPDSFDVIPETTFIFSEDTFIEPDFVVYPAGELEKLSPETCLLAIEVSVSTFRYDMGRKAALCASFGIRDYWVINAKTLETHVHREPSEDGFQSVEALARGEEIKPKHLDNFTLNLKEFK